MVVERSAADMDEDAAARRLGFKHYRHGAALHALAESYDAAARQPGLKTVRAHGRTVPAGSSAFTCCSIHAFGSGGGGPPGCFSAIVPSGLMNQVMGMR